ncbi:hypothetical protein FA95DRAFT_1530464 [Auriscalpium vulgare]|uniref:Uncharacterized protein n=1 Tax=Auriscalpium vulgare TaxID=40419 RepID=A0ACB8SCK5_9AGAM|nr:hypothetical protein FA95DRAFT_1530464 [Auriscalpium vulgare]
MKVNVSQEEFAELQAESLRGSIEGIVGGLAVSLPLSYLAHRKWAAYRALPPSLKALGVIIIVAPSYAIRTEHRVIQYDRAHNWQGASKILLDQRVARQHAEDEAESALSYKDQFQLWVNKNQYQFILGSWVASMAVAGTIIMRDRHQSTSQKVVQARMWAQGLTIGVLVAAGILTHTQREEALLHPTIDHSWKDLLEAEAREADDRKIKNLSPAESPL